MRMAQEGRNIDEQVVVGEQKGSVEWAILKRTRQLNTTASEEVLKLAEDLETWEKDDKTKLIVTQSAGDDVQMFYDGQFSSLNDIYTMYWLCYHIHTYKKTQVAIVDGICNFGSASLMFAMKFSVVTEKIDFATLEASLGFHTDCGFSYIHSRLPGHLGEFLALTGTRLNGKELVAVGMATHFVPSAKLVDLVARLWSLDSGDMDVVRSTIEEFSEKVELDKDSILNKLSIIDKCCSKESVKQIIQEFEAEGSKEGNEWVTPIMGFLKQSSPTGLKINLRSIREGRKQTLAECLKKEFRVSVNILRGTISNDAYEGARALTIDKDNRPGWNPATLDEVDDEKINLVFLPLEDDIIELRIPETEDNRLNGKELVAVGMATHFVPLDKVWALMPRLARLDSGDTDVVRSTIEEFSEKVDLDEDSILNKQSIIDACFSKESVKQIIQAFEAEGSKEGNEWITPILKRLKESSPTALKINLRSIREARNQTLGDCLKKEFRITVNIMRSTISIDAFEGVRALTIAKDNCPRWNPATLDEVDDEKIKLVFKPLEDDLELRIPETEENRWEGKAETSGFASVRG
ncbi:hypothetical protein HID58_031201 [Brassica napus]|uniref:3-hydroxyisobutyryl-CoA hydrolase n=2 Tax=Brassica napus TaxID=3708 RepID=A0ABQ8CI89_BRANA|nr:hypothetical protein HID58_031201 [Brassica napus]